MGGRGARWRLGGKCRGGEGRRRCRGGWGCRRELPRGTVVATDAGEQGEQLDRDGEHLLPTCRVRKGCRRAYAVVCALQGAGGVAGRGEQLGLPKQVAEVITRGASERVQVRNRGGHQGGHAQNVQECGAVCAQICTETRKCPGDTFGDRHHLCRIRR